MSSRTQENEGHNGSCRDFTEEMRMIEGTEDDKVEKRVVERENRDEEERRNKTESHGGGRERKKERN